METGRILEFNGVVKRGKGMYFIVHRSILNDVEHLGTVDVYEEFFKFHPNGHVIVAEYVAVELSPELIEDQRSMIRMASYNWEDVKGMHPGDKVYQIPSNYLWFLHRIKENRLIGWLDFVAGVVCGVPVDHTINYMGIMYANMTTLSSWMFTPSLLPKSMRRCWIFQESAFGPLDEAGIDNLLVFLQNQGSKVLTGDRTCMVGEFADTAIAVSRLLERRGWSSVFAQVKPSLPFHEYGEGTFSALMQKRLQGRKELMPERGNSYQVDSTVVEELDRVFQPPRNLISVAVFHILDYFTRGLVPEANPVWVLMKKLLCEKPWQSLEKDNAFESFARLYGRSIVMAYVSCEVTYESDRDNAVTAVARAIARDSFNVPSLDTEQILSIMWQQSIKAASDRGSTVVAFPTEDSKAIPTMRFKGLSSNGELRGTPLVGSESHNLSYRTQDGHIHTFSSSNHPQIDRFGATHVSGNIWRHDLTGEEATFYICGAPYDLRKVGATVLILLCRSCDNAPLNIRIHVGSGGPEMNSSSWPKPADTITLR